jgi:MFS family permease
VKSDQTAPRVISFWVLASMLSLFLFAASAPSPLYPVYAARWGFSSITLTAVYAIYAGGALLALLTSGRLSDHLGRRKVVVAALLIQIAGVAAFIGADSVELLFIGRILNGVATGVATGAISAWLLDLQPPDKPSLGGLVGGVAVLAGLGTGAFGSGLLVQYALNPLRLVYWLLVIAFAAALVSTFFIPDVADRSPGAFRSMRPRVGVPAVARSAFVALLPSLVAIWALGGLYLSLGPSLAITLAGDDSRVAGGLVIMALLGVGAASSTVVRAVSPRVVLIRGSLVLIAGVGITLVAVAMGSTTGLYAGSVFAGLGFGPAFSGVMRTLTPLAPPDKRGALLASTYIAIYLSFSIPTVIAGFAVANFPLLSTTYVYGLTVMTLAAITTVAVASSKRPPVAGVERFERPA